MTAVYYLFCGFSVLTAFLAEKKNSKILLALSLFFVCFIAGFRAENVGLDTASYYTYINWAGSGILQNVEIGFIYFSKFLLRIINTPKFVVFVYSSLTIIFIFLRFWTLRDKASYSLMVFLYLALYFQLSLNIMRQFFAVAIVFFATYFLQNKKSIPYFIFVVIASLFHVTAILGIGIYIVYYWYTTEKAIKKILFSIVMLACIPVIIYYGGSTLDKYSIYFKNINVNVGLLVFAKGALLLIFIYCNQSILFSKYNQDNLIKIITILYLIGIGLTFMGYIFEYMERLGLGLMIFEPVCLAIMCKRRNASLFKIAVFSLALFIIFMSYLSNGNGIFPYNWIF